MSDLLDYCPEVYDGTVHEIYLLKHVKFTAKEKNKLEIPEFIVHCDPGFEVNSYAKRDEESKLKLHRISVIEYFSTSDKCLCVGQVVGIIEYFGIVQFLVSRLQEVDFKSSFRKLPYALYKYALEKEDNTYLTFEHVPIADVVAPCFCMPAVDHVNIDFNYCGIHHVRKEQTSYFYVLTTNRTNLTEGLVYDDYIKYNSSINPWPKNKKSEVCLNFNYYLTEKEKLYVRDVLNA